MDWAISKVTQTLTESANFFLFFWSADGLMFMGYMLPLISICMFATLYPLYKYVQMDFGETLKFRYKIVLPVFAFFAYTYHRAYLALVFSDTFVPDWQIVFGKFVISAMTSLGSWAITLLESGKVFFLRDLWC